jgi:multidrug efflux pump subunit AcrB
MDLIRLAIRQPVTISVAVILIILAGVISLSRLPIQLTPNVESTVATVTTRWEGASPEEVELDVVDKQEERLIGLSNLHSMTSESQQGQGIIRLEFNTGTDLNAALREISDKLREVPEYPENVDEPVIQDSDRESRDYIAWIMFGTTDPNFDIRTLRDFATDRIEPTLERVPGISEINVLGGREREVQIRIDPDLMAQYGITPTEFAGVIRDTNQNVSAGAVEEGKLDIRLRMVSKYDELEKIRNTVVKDTEAGPILVRDLAAQIVQTYKEPTSFVRSQGRPVIAINAERAVGSNVMDVMDGLKSQLERLNAPGGILEAEARALGLNGELYLDQVYDQTTYINEALALVRNNIFIGGSLAVMVLILFLRSLRSVTVVVLAIPISVIGSVVAMVAMGRSINVISLAGMAFAVGMVVDNAIVVLENIFRHIEMGKKPFQAAYDGAREVWGAVLASTLTTIVVFIPILLVQEEAGQLFRDIALAICASVALSLIVSITVIPTASARLLRTGNHRGKRFKRRWAAGLVDDAMSRLSNLRAIRPWLVFVATFLIALIGLFFVPWDPVPFANYGIDLGELTIPYVMIGAALTIATALYAITYVIRGWNEHQYRDLPPEKTPQGFVALYSRIIYILSRSVPARLAVIGVLTALSIYGTIALIPPSDYLPKGNRNLVFGMVITPPGYNIDQMRDMAERMENVVKPFWEAGDLDPGSEAYKKAVANLPQVPTINWMTHAPGPPVTPPPVDNYFAVSFEGILFHGATSVDPSRVADVETLLNHASRTELLPGTIGWAQQIPLFRLGGRTGSAVKVEFAGPDLDEIVHAASEIYGKLGSEFGYGSIQPVPGNFNIPGPEVQVRPDLVRLSEVGLTPDDIGLVVRANGDGAVIDDYLLGGETIDLTVITPNAVDNSQALPELQDRPIATGSGRIVTLASVAKIVRTTAPQEIARSGRQRAVTFEITPPEGYELESAVARIEEIIAKGREDGLIAPSIQTDLRGSASKLAAVQAALLGDGTFIGTISSSLVLALVVVYLLMCVLFQSYVRPIVIMFSVPLATLGGFLALRIVHIWSAIDRYMPMQMLDVLTMLGFVILIGIVVNNAILIVHQAMNFLSGRGALGVEFEGEMTPRRAVAEAVRTRVRPIFMSMFTSVGGMLPLVVMPGSGSELYRGLGSVVVGGLIVSTIFTLMLVPMLLSLVLETAGLTRKERAEEPVLDAGPEPAGTPAAASAAMR